VIRIFKHDEPGYQSWLEENPEGFVFNHLGGRDPKYNIIHNASCRHLHRPADEGVRTNVEKICSDNLEELMNKATGLRGPAGWGCCKVCLG
jgi:hypothetical protein